MSSSAAAAKKEREIKAHTRTRVGAAVTMNKSNGGTGNPSCKVLAQTEKADKENPCKKPCVLPSQQRSVSRGRATASFATLTNVDSVKEKDRDRSKQQVLPRPPSSSKNPSRAGDIRKSAKDEDPAVKAIRRSATSIPSVNPEKGKRSGPTPAPKVSNVAASHKDRERGTVRLQSRNRNVIVSEGGVESKDPAVGESKDVEKKKSEGLEGFKSQGLSEGKDRGPSKLQERLAFLEGRVQQIANDLKKTQEMLDSNDVDASRNMISHIQLSLSGIEKEFVMSSMAESVPSSVSLSMDVIKEILPMSGDVTVQNSCEDSERSSQVQVNQGVNEVAAHLKNCSATILNSEDLEERLFPHQKLLRNRLSIQNQCQKTDVAEIPAKLPDHNSGSILGKNSTADMNFETSGEECGNLKKGSLENAGEVPSSSEKENKGDQVASVTEKSFGNEIPVNDSDDKLECDEILDADEGDKSAMQVGSIELMEESPVDQLYQLGHKTSTAGWFVSDGESVLLAHDDGCCSFHDIANCEMKAEYKVPYSVASNIWEDCWLIRAPCSDGRSGKYVVAASAGNALDGGFCSWDFYSKQMVAFHTEIEPSTSSSGSSSQISGGNVLHRNSGSRNPPHNWWYRPCGPLIVSTGTGQRTLKMYDIRDGELVMSWKAQRDVANMAYSSPLQWKDKVKVLVAETEAISLWDVNSLQPQPLNYVTFPGRKALSLYVHNSDGESTGGVRKRLSSSEFEGNDGVFCMQDSVNVFDFRVPSGIGLKIPAAGESGQSLFARGDSIFGGMVNARVSSKAPVRCRVNQWSLRKGKLVCSYSFPDCNTFLEQVSIAQVWGSSNLVMAINGNGLAVFDAYREENFGNVLQESPTMKELKEVIGPDDLYHPSFDYCGSRILLVSKDRPAIYRRWT